MPVRRWKSMTANCQQETFGDDPLYAMLEINARTREPIEQRRVQTRRDMAGKADAITLQRAVEKLVRFGQQIGVSPEEMISPLDSGIRVADLLAFLATKRVGVRSIDPRSHCVFGIEIQSDDPSSGTSIPTGKRNSGTDQGHRQVVQ